MSECLGAFDKLFRSLDWFEGVCVCVLSGFYTVRECMCVSLWGYTRLEGVGVSVCVLERFHTVRGRSRRVFFR